MPKTSYKAGDIIVLKSRSHGDLTSQKRGKIIAVLPETRGSISFRVRLEGENFDRNVSRDDIDPTGSMGRKSDVATHETKKSNGWINHDLVRTKK